MSIKKIKGFRFVAYKIDHPPPHVHVYKGRRYLGRFDVVRQKSMDAGFKIEGQAAKALRKAGFLLK